MAGIAGLAVFNGTTSDGGVGSPGITNTAILVVGRGADLCGWYLYNPNDEASYVNVYDAAAAADVTVGTTNPKWQFSLGAGVAANVLGESGIQFDLGIVVSATKTAGSNTAPDVVMEVVLFYR